MAIDSFVPTIWSETLLRQLNKKYVAVANCNRQWDGQIKQLGDKVRVLGINPVGVVDYKKNSDTIIPSNISGFYSEFYINQAKAFHFQVDDIDRIQGAVPEVMQEALRTAVSSLANEADKYVFSLYNHISEGNTITVNELTVDNVIDTILDGVLKLQNKGVTEEIVLEVSPSVASIILRAKLSHSTNNLEAIDKGCIGYIAGCKVYVSHNIQAESTYHKCYMRTRRAIAFAEQFSEIEAYRPERRFADAIKGLMLYGASIVCPDEILLLNINIA